MYKRKTQDVYIIMGNYGYGWAELCTYEDKKEAKEDLKAYKENEKSAIHKIIVKRVKLEKEN